LSELDAAQLGLPLPLQGEELEEEDGTTPETVSSTDSRKRKVPTLLDSLSLAVIESDTIQHV
jgi:hypothetical protein